MSSRSLVRGALALLALLSVPAAAQVVARVQPAAFAPGAVVRLTGHDLQGVREVLFTALLGGETSTLSAAPLQVAADELLVVAPAFADRAGAELSSPWAWLGVRGAAPQPVYLLEGTAGRLVAAGSGSQLASGDRLCISFDLAGGEPRPGNRTGTLELLGAPPGASAFLAAGLPACGPRTRLRDASLVVDLAPPCVLLGPFPVDADGLARAPLPVPMAVGLRLAVQWIVAQPADDALLSDALLIEL